MKLRFCFCFDWFRLEDPDSEETKQFVDNQVKLTDSVLAECDTRDKLKEKITELFDYPRFYPPFKKCDKYFYFHNSGLQPQSVLYVQVSTLNLFLFERWRLLINLFDSIVYFVVTCEFVLCWLIVDVISS